MQPAAKRARGGGPKGPRDPRKIAMAIGARQKAQFPYAQFGRIMHRRGTPEGIARLGATWKTATPEQRQTRKDFGYSGRGLYTGRGSYRDFLGGLRQTYETLTPKAWRDAVSDSGASMIRGAASRYGGGGLYTGRGGYNELVSSSLKPAAMPIGFSGSGDETSSVTITNREYISDFYAPTTNNTFSFQNQVFDINPGLAQVFPWLSQIAANFEEYQFEQLVFQYQPTIQENTSSSTGQTGSLILATNYNPSQPPFEDKEKMMQYHGGQSDRVTAESIHGVECDPAKADNPRRYVRTAPVILGQDLKSFDVGKFQAATANLPAAYANQQLGEIWVYYTVKLSIPKLGTQRGDLIQQDIWCSDSSGGQTKTLLTMFDTSVLKAQQSSLNARLTVDGTTPNTTTDTQYVLTMPASCTGDFELRVRLEGGDFTSAGSGMTFQALGQCTFVADMYAANGPTTTPSHVVQSQGITSGAWGPRLSFVLHFKTRAAVGGTDNVIKFKISAGAAPTITQAVCELIERSNSMYTSSHLPQPVFVNSLGQVVNPG